MAELADALDLGSSGETRTGSIPARRTKRKRILLLEIYPSKKEFFDFIKDCYGYSKKVAIYQYF